MSHKERTRYVTTHTTNANISNFDSNMFESNMAGNIIVLLFSHGFPFIRTKVYHKIKLKYILFELVTLVDEL